MRVGGRDHGYTIVEVLIFLAVTVTLFVLIVGSLSGQQGKAEFTHGMREVQAQVDDIINDVSTGYYTHSQNFSCSDSGGAPLPSSAAPQEQGTNEDCVFLGRAIQFNSPGSSNKNYRTYSIVGLRQVSGTQRDVATLSETQPTALAPTTIAQDSDPGFPQSEQITYPVGVTIGCTGYTNDCTGQQLDAVALISGLSSAVANTTAAGSIPVDILPLVDGSGTKTKLTMANTINGISNSSARNPATGVIVCFISDHSNQHALLTIGSNSRRLATELSILGGRSCS